MLGLLVLEPSKFRTNTSCLVENRTWGKRKKGKIGFGVCAFRWLDRTFRVLRKRARKTTWRVKGSETVASILHGDEWAWFSPVRSQCRAPVIYFKPPIGRRSPVPTDTPFTWAEHTQPQPIGLPVRCWACQPIVFVVCGTQVRCSAGCAAIQVRKSIGAKTASHVLSSVWCALTYILQGVFFRLYNIIWKHSLLIFLGWIVHARRENCIFFNICLLTWGEFMFLYEKLKNKFFL